MKSGEKIFDSPSDCERKEDLVTYLYGESNETDRASFERHLDDCEGCRNGLTAFRGVRHDLGAWQLEQLAHPEITLRRSRLDLLHELIGTFPVWARGASLIGAAAAMLLVSLSIAGMRVSLKDGDFTVSFGRTGNPAPLSPAASSEEVNLMVQNAMTEERKKMEELYGARLANFKDRIEADYQAKLQAASAEQQARLKATQAVLQQEMRRINRQHTSGIRSFFARDDSIDPWGDGGGDGK
jgi:Putative zinc-finger